MGRVPKSGFPVIRSASPVPNRENLNHSFRFPINNEEGKAGELDLARAAWSKKPAFWCSRDSLNGLIDFIDEPSRSALIVMPIPACRVPSATFFEGATGPKSDHAT